jgi:hypothetical protein
MTYNFYLQEPIIRNKAVFNHLQTPPRTMNLRNFHELAKRVVMVRSIMKHISKKLLVLELRWKQLGGGMADGRTKM